MYGRDQFDDPKPEEPGKVLARMNAFLAQLNRAGAEIKAVIPVTVDMGDRDGYSIGGVRETKQLLIIEKKPK